MFIAELCATTESEYAADPDHQTLSPCVDIHAWYSPLSDTQSDVKVSRDRLREYLNSVIGTV